ncbi:AraC family transcriptional regulator [Aliivibrio fischeri]|uniref:Transcriptional regulator, AraC family n=1 Tax=Aliivibrio fischeri (strain ATCC 700601 / ES114) TaxID=312309 RepID=Q5E3W4_ALIF1|nr:AraC family transcriptional regulator [Aliivibrio fischeri]AAW86282.1 transcriptional regulator, AraC family [Aliivibrio fischeri ES114]KLU79427.1 AraC family transcriptional regulator [Aliivibrio fischeri]MBP3142443.1 helix-turn-helix domain-containing protein [Aliivibrio fischeri]MBP3156932.1 helix-turn-helix domain-containing protein [Aliivibrio fischeri]MCE7572778.1 AraC family transcriptional regulator [Aliivibrio fischeri]
MKANLERVPIRIGSSWRYKKIDGVEKNCHWHFHNEYELVLFRKNNAKGMVGHFERVIEKNTLWLIPPKMPHAIELLEEKELQCESHIIWLPKEWVENMIFSCTELRRMGELFKRSSNGLCFSTSTAEKVYQLIEKLFKDSILDDLGYLIQILGCLCSDKETRPLQLFSKQEASDKEGKEKIDLVCQYIDDNYQNSITLLNVAEHLCTSESTIHRLFQSHFGESFSQYLKKLRLNHAANLLTHSRLPIGIVAEQVGYRNQTNFNRLFKDYKQLTPNQYRKKFSSL